MKFGLTPLADAEGAILAHAVKQGDLVLKKGVVLGAGELARLAAAGVAGVVAARLEPGDVGEDAAALRLAQALAGAAVRVENPFTGRSNLFAESAGVLRIDAGVIAALNGVDEAVTVATLPDFKAVTTGEMIATVKIIPFSVPEGLVACALAVVAAGAISVAPFHAKRIAMISTLLPGLKPSVVDKTVKVMGERIAPAGAAIVSDVRVAHEAGALAAALRAAAAGRAEMIVVFGASAITDRADVIPAAIEAAGGKVVHFGMPVDPGNLLLIGEMGGRPVLGAPGCARSPRENGFDWVLNRMLADIPVTRADIQAMGVGGLLMEIVSRPQPRAPDAPPAPAMVAAQPPELAVLLLAAGRSTRMGAVNKLLALHGGRPLVRHAAEAALAAAVGPVTVVTGHQAEEVRAALSGLPLHFVHNAAYAEGLSTSVKAGVAALAGDAQGAIVMLGDMPLVAPAVVRRLAAAFAENPGAKAVAPTVLGERGNPVLIGHALFARVSGLTGDVGARPLIEAAGEGVIDLPVDDPGVRTDIDTPEALATLRGGGQNVT